MRSSENAELAAAYDAVSSMLELTESQTFRFRIGAMGDGQWKRMKAAVQGIDAGEHWGVEQVELARCAKSLAPGVYRRLLSIAQTPILAERCATGANEPAEIESAESECVVYLIKLAGDSVRVPAERPTQPGVPSAISGIRSKVRSTKSA